MKVTEDLMSALASTPRLELLKELRTKELECTEPENCDLSDRCCNVGELAEAVGLTQPTVSHHLKELRRAGLIITEKDGRTLYCSIDENTFELLSEFMQSFCTNGGDSC